VAQQERIIKAIPADKVTFFTALLEAEGFTVNSEAQPGGTTNLTGTREVDEPQPAPDGDRKIAWGKKVSPEFKKKVLECCGRLGVNPDFLMAAMAFETGGTFDPQAHNASTDATGIIQFTPATARGLGTSVEALRQMTAVEQLEFVEAHFRPFANRLATLEDTYMAILLPSAVGKPNDHVLFSEGSDAYAKNKPLDRNNDGKVTKAEATELVMRRLEKGSTDTFFG
jgi:hypothetical protein